MDTVFNLVAKWSGAEKAWSFMDGKKAYGTCFLGILGGLSGLAAEFAPVLAAHDTAALWKLVAHVTSDPSYLLLLGSCAAIAKLHRSDKEKGVPLP